MIKKLTLLFFFFCSLLSFSQDNLRFCEQINALQNLINAKHYSAKALNDSTSQGVFEIFIKILDPEKDYFLESDILKFKTEELKFDNYISNSNCQFLNNYALVLEKRIQALKKKIEALKNEPLDYSGNLTLQFTPRKDFSYSKTESAQELRLRKKISYKIITKLIEEQKDINTIEANFKTLETEAKTKVINNELCLLEEFLNKSNGILRFAEEAFLNAMVQVNDPNSTFFNNTEKTTYENQLSKSIQSFGIITQKNNTGDIVVAHIIPGSSAFKNGKIEENDVIKSLTSNKNSLEILCVSNQDVNMFLEDENNQEVTFSLKKKNGTLQNITLIKSKINVEDNAVRGYLLNTNKTIGYIKIPSFYTDRESPNGKGLTSDIAKELYKLQKENISALILDLRFNGGGSMQEAIALSGMFIDRGPISIIQSKDNKNFTIRDNKRGQFFNKPLLIIVNEFSASASELFAAAMQDYNRAIIVGSQTYGKSSAQLILPLSANKNYGFSKITTDVFYRPTGKSHQSIGVIPDITFPSLYDNFETAESFKPYALKNDSTTIKLKHKPLKLISVKNIAEKSKTRLELDSNFYKIKETNKTLHKLLFNKGEKYPLSLKSIALEKEKRKKIMDYIFNNETKAPILFSTSNTTSTQEIINYNEKDKVENEKIKKIISQDIVIKESLNILIDYLTLTPN